MTIKLTTLNNDKLIQAGHMGIANCILNIITSQQPRTPELQAKLKRLEALQDHYYEVLLEPESLQKSDVVNPDQSKKRKE